MLDQVEIKDKIETDKSIKVSAFRKDKWKTIPHKHNSYLEIIYLFQGSGYHYIDTFKYPIIPPVIFFIRKEQAHYWDMDSEPDGFVAIIKKTFIDTSLDDELKSLFEKISEHACISVKDNSTIHKLIELLTEENKANDENRFHIMEGLLKSLLAKVLEVAIPVIHNNIIKTDLYHLFTGLLHDKGHIKSKVNFYAEKLNTTPQNLNAVCRKAVSRTAADILSEYIITEAKRLLLYTNQTVSEISFTLDFNDPSHFVKYFKRIIGQTPQHFRDSKE